MLKKENFLSDSVTNVWVPSSGAKGFAYADGDEHELLEKIKACGDRSLLSTELLPYSGWSQEYHLSPERGNLVRALADQLKPGARVLELGAGCGGVSRALGELGFVVDAVEGSFDRAAVAAARCSDLADVAIYCANFGDIDFGVGTYDVVTLIGVLEYAPLFFSTENPFQEALSIAVGHLSEQGVLVVAIENQLGLKYFNGMKEDHVGASFFGVSDFYQVGGATAQTFSKEQLRTLVSAAGLSNVDFYYPYPDYKVPAVILTEEGFLDQQIQPYQVINGYKARDYSTSHIPLFHEASVLRVLGRDGLAQFFANSFALLASRKSLSKAPWIVKCYATRRRPQYCTETKIYRLGQTIRVSKKCIGTQPNENMSSNTLFEFAPTEEVSFVDGTLLSFELERSLFLPPELCWKETKRLLNEWLSFLFSNSKDECFLDGSYYDAIPGNLIRQQGQLAYFDAEWRATSPIRIALPVLRGIVALFTKVEEEIWLNKMPHRTLLDLCKDLLAEYGYKITDEEIETNLALDGSIHEAIMPGVAAEDWKTNIQRVIRRDLNWVRLKRRLPFVVRIARGLKRRVSP